MESTEDICSICYEPNDKLDYDFCVNIQCCETHPICHRCYGNLQKLHCPFCKRILRDRSNLNDEYPDPGYDLEVDEKGEYVLKPWSSIERKSFVFVELTDAIPPMRHANSLNDYLNAMPQFVRVDSDTFTQNHVNRVYRLYDRQPPNLNGVMEPNAVQDILETLQRYVLERNAGLEEKTNESYPQPSGAINMSRILHRF